MSHLAPRPRPRRFCPIPRVHLCVVDRDGFRYYLQALRPGEAQILTGDPTFSVLLPIGDGSVHESWFRLTKSAAPIAFFTQVPMYEILRGTLLRMGYRVETAMTDLQFGEEVVG